ncbi:Retrotransposon gag protein [Arachis hypogaea]|nr:Retrotransposon gag protein [Arachis hypogaea]
MNKIRSSIRNLEVQVGQLSKRITKTPPSTLPSNTEENPKRECKAITMTNMAEPGESKEDVIPSEKNLMGCPLNEKEFPFEEPGESEAHTETIEILLNLLLPFMSSDEYSSSEEDEDITEEQVAKYLEAIMKLNAKLFGNETREDEPPLLTNELNDLIRQTLSQKKPDPGKFLIPCTIGTMTFEKALCDLGSSINLMPLSVMEKLGILDVQAVRISLEMADNSRKQAYGLVEDVLVKVEGLYIPANFIILNTGKNKDESIILGRPFLATAKAVIDVDRGELVLKANEDYLVFKAKESPSVHIEKKHDKFLSMQSQTEPPHSNSKFGVGRPSSCSGYL